MLPTKQVILVFYFLLLCTKLFISCRKIRWPLTTNQTFRNCWHYYHGRIHWQDHHDSKDIYYYITLYFQIPGSIKQIFTVQESVPVCSYSMLAKRKCDLVLLTFIRELPSWSPEKSRSTSLEAVVWIFPVCKHFSWLLSSSVSIGALRHNTADDEDDKKDSDEPKTPKKKQKKKDVDDDDGMFSLICIVDN